MADLQRLADRRRHKLFSNVQLMFVASIVLSVASYYTTFLGMSQYVAKDEWWLAAAITFGLQSIMFATAWIAAEALGTSLRAFFVYLMIYCLCALVSIFFSFSSLFNSIFDETQRDLVNSSYMRKFYQESVLGLESELDQQINATHSAVLADPAFSQWRENVEAVISLRRSAPDVMNQRVETAQNDLENSLSTLSAEVASMKTKRQGVGNEQEQIDTDLTALDARLGSAQAEVTALRAEQLDLRVKISVLEAQMKAELEGVGNTPGKGPKYKAFELQHDALVRDLIPIDTRINVAEQDPDLARRQKLIERRQAIQSEMAQMDVQIEAENARLANLLAQVALTAGVAVVDGTQSIEQMQAAIRRASASATSFEGSMNEVSTTCAAMLEELKAEPQLSTVASSLTCDYGALQAKITNLIGLVNRRNGFAQQCQAAVIPVSTDGEAFTALVNATEACITKAGTQGDALRTELSYLISARGPTAHPFVVAQNALFVDRLPVSYMAGVIAIVIDLLIILVALMAQMAQSSRFEKALQALQDVRFEDRVGGKVAYVDILPKSYNFPERKNLARDLIALNFAYFDDEKNRLYIGSEGREYLRERLEHERS